MVNMKGLREIRLDENEEREVRNDFVRIGKNIKLTPQGFARIPATFTKCGVFRYKRADGTTVRELRHPDDVLKPESLATLKAAPVIEGHSVPLVTAGNYKNIQLGYVTDEIRTDTATETASGEVIIQNPQTLSKINSGELKEMSPGYTMILDRTPGIYKGQEYDQRQTDIQYNHIALGRPGFGRQGPDVGLRLDSIYFSEEDTMKVKIRLDGIDYEVEVADGIASAFKSAIEKEQKLRLDAETALIEAKNAASKAAGETEAAKKVANDLQVRLDAATSPETVEKLANERADLINTVKNLTPKVEVSGKSNHVIRCDSLTALGFDVKDKDEAFVTGAFLFASKSADKVADKKQGGFPNFAPNPDLRQDSKEEETAEAAHRRMIKANRSAGKE